MKKKRLFTLIGSICLSLVLAALLLPACAPAVPEAEEIAELEAEIDDLEGDVAAEKAKVKHLKAEIAALKKPAEVIKVKLQSGEVGMILELCELFEERMEQASGGYFDIEVIAGEAMVPTEEMLGATRDGVFDLYFFYPGYHKDQLLMLDVLAGIPGTLRDRYDGEAFLFETGFADFVEEQFNTWNLHWIFSQFHYGDSMFSTVPVPDVDAVAGMKFRSAGIIAEGLAKLGASTVWFPGEEIYTGLATGLVEAATYDCPAVNYLMGWHEVTKYWIMPPMRPACSHGMVANIDFWNTLTDADKALIRVCVIEMSDWRNFRNVWESMGALKVVQEEWGITVQWWDDESQAKWAEAIISCLEPHPADPAAAKAQDYLWKFMKMRGYSIPEGYGS